MSEQLEEILTHMVSKSEEQQAQILQNQKQIDNLIDAIKLKIGIAAPVAVNVQPAVVDPLVARAEKDCQIVQDKSKFTDKSKISRQVQNFILRINLSRNE